MPDKDPSGYSMLAYLAFGGLSVWGGLAAYIETVRREGRQFRWMEALLQIVVSGFAGMLTMLLCWYVAVPLPLCGFLAGMAGLMGTRALEQYERRTTRWMGGRDDK